MAFSPREFKKRGPDPDWYLNRKLRTIAKRGKRITLRIEHVNGEQVDILGSTQPLAKFVFRDDSYIVIDVPPGIFQVYRVDKVLGVDHIIVEFMLEFPRQGLDLSLTSLENTSGE